MEKCNVVLVTEASARRGLEEGFGIGCHVYRQKLAAACSVQCMVLRFRRRPPISGSNMAAEAFSP
jgi:hypothetical protein